MTRIIFVLAIVLAVASVSSATSITVDSLGCVGVPGGCPTDTNGAYYSDQASNPDVVFRYLVEDWQNIARLDSVTVDYSVLDDQGSDPIGAKGEAGKAILFGRSLGTENVGLNGFGPNLNKNKWTPLPVSTTITNSEDLSALLEWMRNHDGHLKLRIRSTNGDYDIFGDPTISINATTVPEPATFAVIGVAVAGLGAMRRRFGRS